MAASHSSSANPGIHRWDRTGALITLNRFGAAPMRKILSRLMRDRLGVTVIEYAMIGSLIGICAIAAKMSIGKSLSSFFTAVSTGL
jgi:Flp pilus assembly pilin Flp